MKHSKEEINVISTKFGRAAVFLSHPREMGVLVKLFLLFQHLVRREEQAINSSLERVGEGPSRQKSQAEECLYFSLQLMAGSVALSAEHSSFHSASHCVTQPGHVGGEHPDQAGVHHKDKGGDGAGQTRGKVQAIIRLSSEV